MEKPRAQQPETQQQLPTREQLQLEVRQDNNLEGNRRNAEILIKKLTAEEEGESEVEPRPDSFDGRTIKLLEDVLVSKDRAAVTRAVLPIAAAGGGWFYKRILTPIVPKVLGAYGGLEGASEGMDWAHKYVTKDVAARGETLIRKAVLEESGIFDPHKGIAGTISNWLASAEKLTNVPQDSPGFSGGVLEGLRGLAQQATHDAAEGAHATVEQLIKWINELWIFVSHIINLAVQNGGKIIVDGMAEAGGLLAGPVGYTGGAIGAYLGVSFVAGAGFEIASEIKRSAGFEQMGEYVDRSEQMIKTGQKNEDGSDPRHELMVLEQRIMEDPNHLGHKLSNEEWLHFAAAVRNARVSLLKEKISHQDNILHTPEEQQELSRRAEIISQFVDDQNSIADADEELATKILDGFNRAVVRESRSAEEKVYNYNSVKEKAKRYGRAFARGGLNGTGIVPFMRTTAKFAARATKLAIPGSRFVFKS
jgi:Trp operon repressor